MDANEIVGGISDFINGAFDYMNHNSDAVAFIILAALAILAAIHVVTSK